MWAQALASRRPLDDLAGLLKASDTAWNNLSEADWLEAFASHPRIGSSAVEGKGSPQSAAWSVQEQSDVTRAADSAKLALAQANRDYEQRFGRIFIICATGKSAPEILENLKRRMNNEERAEMLESAEQQRQIIQLRLKKWLSE